MARQLTKPSKEIASLPGYHEVRADIVKILESARHTTAKTVNRLMTAAYWEVGRRIVEFEQQGKHRAKYGDQLIERLSIDLRSCFGRGFGISNLRQMRIFYLTWPDRVIRQTVSGELSQRKDALIIQTPSEKFDAMANEFLLPWSQYVRLLSLRDVEARDFYEKEALRGGWSVRQLDRQIESMFFERTMLSKNKATLLKKGATKRPTDEINADEAIRDPFVLEFLDLKDEYSENDLEEALIRKLEHFLLELGNDFTFVGRQKRLRVGDAWYRIDLLFFHRRLRCMVVIDLKLGKFTHADAGQMHLYLNYVREHWTNPDENPPVGLILCAQKDTAVAHYALEGLPNKVLAAEYRMTLPNEKTLVKEIKQTQKLIALKKG